MVFCLSVIVVPACQQNGADPERPELPEVDAIVINPLRRWSEYCPGD
ncbi:hypothetical protein ppKF707_3898 [Metapseudomonas furukawaii]|uniref:Uncharacterized protein n=1 Tax=Metapseudomonas furukawaii TaxID=1149133 RepID=A0AAD1C0G0_METFU|nr:hypothetical protein ppKF707_3898 [Pseudomonas furukawaii]BAU73683.1 hypothetical protein KF707C_19950 [Pseudomonas furukawaii]